ncbi:AI-2E family transporter [Aliagarivorans taiwanensis]|uniref:AI-2E family transporter n=1 Tax=Aliagarivorans taiwanensis TaxID=561966 RepID=UPI00041D51D2|nr:AI-2E family transporter [Aliagarivorans taiwanensis]
MKFPAVNREANFRDGLLICASIIVVLAGLKAATPVLIPFLLSLFIAIIANPLVKMLTKLRIPRVLAVLAVLVLIIVALMLIAGVVGNSVNDFRAAIPEYRDQLLQRLGGVVQLAARFDIEVNMSMITGYFDPGVVLGLFANTLSGLSGAATNIFMILLVTVFMLLEADSMPQRLHYALHSPDIRMSQIDRSLKAVNNYIAVKALISLITATPVLIVLSMLRLDYAVMWALLAFLLNFIPNVGSLIAAIPPIILALVQFGVKEAAIVMALYFSVNMVVGNMIEPRVMGKGLGLSSLVVILSLIFWGWLFGSVGMLLSVPLTMILKIALESSESGHWVASLLAHPDELKRIDIEQLELEHIELEKSE